MAKPAQPSFSFLEQFVLDALKAHGFDKLSAADQTSFLPQFLAVAEERLGLALLPQLTSEKAADELNELLQKEATPEQWFSFWEKNVSNFTGIVKNTLENFAAELSTAFNL